MDLTSAMLVKLKFLKIKMSNFSYFGQGCLQKNSWVALPSIYDPCWGWRFYYDSLQLREYCKRFDRGLLGAISEIDLIVNWSFLVLKGFTFKKKLSKSLTKYYSGAYLNATPLSSIDTSS